MSTPPKMKETIQPVYSSPWRKLFDQRQPRDKGLGLSFVSPTICDDGCVATVDAEEVAQMATVWDRALALYVIGASPSMPSISRFVSTAWKDIEKPKIQHHDDGYFVLLFQTAADCDVVLPGGPYTMGDKPVLLKKWTHSFNLHDELCFAPIWVRLLGLPVIYWGAKTLSRISSTIGVPLMVDDCTSKQSRVSFARILIEVNITKPLPTMIKFSNEKGVLEEQRVTYDWVPYFCNKCQMIGHDCARKVKKPVQVTQKWVVKQPQKQPEVTSEPTATDSSVIQNAVMPVNVENPINNPVEQVISICSEPSGIGGNVSAPVTVDFGNMIDSATDGCGPPDGPTL